MTDKERDWRLMDAEELCKLLRCANPRSTRFQSIRKTPTFPRPVKFGRKSLWWAREINDWLLAERERQTT